MPYIKQEDRKRFEEALESTLEAFEGEWSAGDLNYFISSVAVTLFERKKRYQTANDILGALDGVSREFYRRQVANYEDGKIIENGDICEAIDGAKLWKDLKQEQRDQVLNDLRSLIKEEGENNE